MSLIYDNERMTDLWLVSLGIRVGRWSFVVTVDRRL